jgi:hypothetical protein
MNINLTARPLRVLNSEKTAIKKQSEEGKNMFRLLSQAPAQQPMYIGYLLFGGGILLLASLLWRLSRFDARKKT